MSRIHIHKVNADPVDSGGKGWDIPRIGSDNRAYSMREDDELLAAIRLLQGFADLAVGEALVVFVEDTD